MSSTISSTMPSTRGSKPVQPGTKKAQARARDKAKARAAAKAEARAKHKAEALAQAKASVQAKAIAKAQSKSKSKTKALAAADAADDAPPTDIDAFRYEIARRICVAIARRTQSWRGCPGTICKRLRDCGGKRGLCRVQEPYVPDPEQEARGRAMVYRAVQELVHQRRAAEP